MTSAVIEIGMAKIAELDDLEELALRCRAEAGTVPPDIMAALAPTARRRIEHTSQRAAQRQLDDLALRRCSADRLTEFDKFSIDALIRELRRR